MSAAGKPYFINLDALRFIAATGFFMHAFTIRIEGVRYPVWMDAVSRFASSGALCVNVLHVLSGFLITYLLLAEEKSSGQFSIVRYYLRRTLRIWPLYFTMVIAFLFIVPAVLQAVGYAYYETANPWSYFLFWNNFAMLSDGFPYSPVLAILWTVSVEEQFYVVMPWLMKLFRKQRVTVFLAVICISIAFRIHFRHEGVALFFHTLCIMSDFAVGAFVAWLAVNEHPWFLRWKKIPRVLNIGIYVLTLVMVLFYHPIFDSTLATIAERMILGIAFGHIIFDQAFAENKAFNLSSIPGFVWLGKRAFGLYCFHQVGLLASVHLFQAMGWVTSPLQYLLLLPLSAFVITVWIAALSYRFFERPFLNLKQKFEMR